MHVNCWPGHASPAERKATPNGTVWCRLHEGLTAIVGDQIRRRHFSGRRVTSYRRWNVVATSKQPSSSSSKSPATLLRFQLLHQAELTVPQSPMQCMCVSFQDGNGCYFSLTSNQHQPSTTSILFSYGKSTPTTTSRTEWTSQEQTRPGAGCLTINFEILRKNIAILIFGWLACLGTRSSRTNTSRTTNKNVADHF